MIRRALLPFALLVCAIAVPTGGVLASDNMQSTPPGVDTVAPKLTKVYKGCGVYEFTATELTNIPDPPRTPPQPTDQVDAGIASITISSAPASVNAKLTLVTDQTFPKDNSYKTFVFRIEPIDKSKRATAFIFVRDWAEPNSNVTTQEIVIEPPLPTTSDTQVTLTARANNTVTYTVTLRNQTTEVQTLNSVALSGSQLFTLTSGGTSTDVALAPGDSRLIVISYTPNLDSETGDNATLTIVTPCGNITIPVKGTGTLGDVSTTDWAIDSVHAKDTVCKSTFTVTNNGSADVTITNYTPSGPEVQFTPSQPGNITVPKGGGSVVIGDLCYSPTVAGPISASLTLVCDAEKGDKECTITGTAGTEVSVPLEVLTRLNVRFDASTNTVRYNSEASAMLFDIRGNVIGTAVAGTHMLSASHCTSGAYFLVLSENPQVSVPVSVAR